MATEAAKRPHPVAAATSPQPPTTPTTMTTAPKYRRMSAEQRRDHLVASALALFTRYPHHQVLPEQVAAEAGVSRALFYHYFAGMDEVYLAALKVATDDLITRLLPPPGQSLRTQIRHVITELFAFGDQYRTPYIAMHSRHAAATPESYAMVERSRNRLVEHTIRWAGVDEPTPLLTLTLRSWTAVLEGAVLSWLTQGSLERSSLEAWLYRQLVAMLTETSADDPEAARFLATMASDEEATGGA